MNNSKIYVHLVFVTKYRKKILTGEIKDLILDTITQQCDNMRIEIIAMRIDNSDHIHLMLKLRPTHSISLVVQILKEKSRYACWQLFPYFLRKHYWHKNYLWSRGYFCSTTGEASKETVERYINSQG